MICAWLTCGTAWAQPDPDSDPSSDGPSAADKETARTLFKDGDEKFRDKDYEGALKAFRAADEIMGVPTTGLEYARTLMMLGRLLEARDVFIKVANSSKKSDELPLQQTAREEANELAKGLAARIPSVQVAIANVPEGVEARVRIDDVDIPSTAVEFPRKVDPGEHTIKVFVAGFRPVIRTVKVNERDEKVVEITLEESDEEVNLVDPWGASGDSDGDAASGGGLPTLSWIGFSLAVVGLAVGIPTGIMTVLKRGELEDGKQCVDAGGGKQRCPPSFEDELNEAMTIAHVSTASFVVAGVGIAIGVTGILVRRSLPDALAGTKAPITLRPYVSAGGAGFTGTF